MASPHLAGAVALLLDAGVTDAGAPGLFDDVRETFCGTADLATGVQGLFGFTPIPTERSALRVVLRLRRCSTRPTPSWASNRLHRRTFHRPQSMTPS